MYRKRATKKKVHRRKRGGDDGVPKADLERDDSGRSIMGFPLPPNFTKQMEMRANDLIKQGTPPMNAIKMALRGEGRRRATKGRKHLRKKRGGINVMGIDIPITSTIQGIVEGNKYLKDFAPSIKDNVPEDYLPSKLINDFDLASTGATGYLLTALNEAKAGLVAGLRKHGVGRRVHRKKRTTKRR